MSAVFKFPANVEEFFINFDCDKSDLTITLTCRDGHIPHQQHKPMYFLIANKRLNSLITSHFFVPRCPLSGLPRYDLTQREHANRKHMCSLSMYVSPAAGMFAGITKRFHVQYEQAEVMQAVYDKTSPNRCCRILLF